MAISIVDLVAKFLAECSPEDGAVAFASKDNPTGMFTRVETITPERATELLKRIPPGKQRRVRPTRVENYCKQRQGGTWRLHHQGIALDVEGVLRDGQYRLSMIEKSGLSTTLLVAYNVPNEGVLHADEQLPRTAKDALRMAGQGNYTNAMVATLRCYLRYPALSTSAFFLSREETLAALQKYAAPLDYSERWLLSIKTVTRGTRAAVSRAFSHVNRERLDQFCEILRTGMPTSENRDHGQVVIVLHKFLVSMGGHHSEEHEGEIYRKSQTAIQAFMLRQPVSRLYGTDKDLYPLPE